MRTALLVALLFTILPLSAPADALTAPADAPATPDPTIAALMAQGQKAFLASDYDTAKEKFEEVVQLDNTNTMAIQFLRIIHTRQASMPKPPKQLYDKVVLPKVELKDATFSAALDFFKQKAADQSVTVSFVPNLPPAQMSRTVTLSLTNVPFLDALNYLCQLDSATYKVEPYAIVITPATADSTSAPAPAAQ
jgi:hypothetical protein